MATIHPVFGKPDDTLGVDNDLAWDYQNRIIWGPKTGGTWNGTAYSPQGPTGPAQLSYPGVPPAAFGIAGNGCQDLSTGILYFKTQNNGWQQTGQIVGKTGPVGATGATGPMGQQGIPGIQGPAGADGAVGAQGAQGSQGAKGDTGATGAPGPQGIAGPAGATGAQGAQGQQGVPGATGPSGVQGAQGPVGSVGSQGPKGDTGNAGATGATGQMGATGQTGAQGAQGPKGDTGATGSAGSQGPQGVAGSKGDQGGQGEVGPMGATGPQGAVGPAGYTSLVNMAMSAGVTLYTYRTTASSTPVRFTSANANFAHNVYLPVDGALLGYSYNNVGVALTASLVDLTANKTVYSASLAANAQGVLGVFAPTLYPMVGGNLHVWRFTGSGTATCQISPFYLAPCGGPGNTLGVFSDFTCPQGTSFSTSTPIYAQLPSSTTTTTQYARTFALPRAGACYSITGTFIPSSTLLTGGQLKATLYDITSGVALCSALVANDGNQATTSFAVSPVAIPAGHTIGLQLLANNSALLGTSGQVNFNIACIV